MHLPKIECGGGHRGCRKYPPGEERRGAVGALLLAIGGTWQSLSQCGCGNGRNICDLGGHARAMLNDPLYMSRNMAPTVPLGSTVGKCVNNHVHGNHTTLNAYAHDCQHLSV